MPASLDHIHHDTPMGATLVADGATFRVWAPHALAVHVLGEFNNRQRSDASLLTRDERGHWRGFIAGARDRHRYMFYVVGEGSEGLKRDPYARELQMPFPSECLIRRADFPWHDSGFVTPRFDDIVIYQLHVGTFFTPNLPRKGGTFLDVARKVPYLAELGVTAVQLMPVQEFQTAFSLGYNGTDYFSPEMDFAVEDDQLTPSDYKNKESFVLVTAYLEGTDGRKMSKSWGNAVWIDDEPREIYGKIMSLRDELIPNYLEIATSLPMVEVKTLSEKASSEPMEIKKQLAYQITKELHSEETAEEAQRYFEETFQRGGVSKHIDEIAVDQKAYNIIDLLVNNSLAPSRSEAKRLVKDGAIDFDERNIADVSEELVISDNGSILKVGKKTVVKLVLK